MYPDFWLLPYVDAETRDRYYKHLMRDDSDYLVLRSNNINFTYYWLLKPWTPDQEALAAKVAAASEDWRQQMEEKRKQPCKWHTQMLDSYPAALEYALFQLVAGRLDLFEEILREYQDWLAWWREQPKKLEMSVDDPRSPQKPLPFFAAWIAARREPERPELGAQAIVAGQEWFWNTFYVLKRSGGYMHEEMLLSMVMRIDLGLEPESCREFARYYGPLLDLFPHIGEQVAALEATPAQPRLLPYEEVRRIRDEYLISRGADPKTF
jgi:hypothetical protein